MKAVDKQSVVQPMPQALVSSRFRQFPNLSFYFFLPFPLYRLFFLSSFFFFSELEELNGDGDVQKKYTFQLLSEESAFPSEQDLYLRDLERLAPRGKDDDDEYGALVCWSDAILFSEKALLAKARLDSSGSNVATPRLMVVAASSVKSLPVDTFFEADLTAFPFPTVLVTDEDGKALQEAAEADRLFKASLGLSGEPVEQRSERVSTSESKTEESSGSVPMTVPSGLRKLSH